MNSTDEVTTEASPLKTPVVPDNEESNSRGFYIRVLILYGILFLIMFFLFPYKLNIMGKSWNWGVAMFFAIVFYTITGIRKIDPDKLATRDFFGKLLDNLQSGFAFVPPLIFTLHLNQRTYVQHEFPAEPGKIYRAPKDDKTGIVPEGFSAPFRVTFGRRAVAPSETAANVQYEDPLGERLTVEVNSVVIYRIVHHHNFLKTIGTPEDAKKQLQDACEYVLAKEFGEVTPEIVIGDYQKYFDKLKEYIEETTKNWGVEIITATFKPLQFSHDLNIALQSIPEAMAQSRALGISGEGEKKKKILLGEGDAQAARDLLNGETEGYAERVRSLSVSGELILSTETAKTLTRNGGTVVVGPDGFSNLLTLASAGKTAVDAIEGNAKK